MQNATLIAPINSERIHAGNKAVRVPRRSPRCKCFRAARTRSYIRGRSSRCTALPVDVAARLVHHDDLITLYTEGGATACRLQWRDGRLALLQKLRDSCHRCGALRPSSRQPPSFSPSSSSPVGFSVALLPALPRSLSPAAACPSTFCASALSHDRIRPVQVPLFERTPIFARAGARQKPKYAAISDHSLSLCSFYASHGEPLLPDAALLSEFLSVEDRCSAADT